MPNNLQFRSDSECSRNITESSSTKKATKKKFDEFMRVLVSHEDLKPLDPNDLILHLFLQGVISDEDYERTKKDNMIKATRKKVRLVGGFPKVHSTSL